MADHSPAWRIQYYWTANHNVPVRDYVDALDIEGRADFHNLVRLLRIHGVLLAYPHCDHLEGKLWELRPFPHRIIYFAHTDHRFILLHAFPKKKGGKTPKRHIQTARKRMNDFLERGL